MLATFIFIVAMFSTMLLIPPLIRSALRLGIVDIPDARKVHKVPIPRIGGIAMIAGAVLPIVLWAPRPATVLSFLAGIGIIAVFGVWDDRKGLDYRIKFLGQLLAILCIVFGGDIYIRYLPMHGVEPIAYWISVPFTIFALLGITNAINLADGLDGLAGGTTFISIAAIALLAYMAGDGTLLMLSTAILGCIVGFLRFNTHPAQVFMGDAGSQFLGFSAGVLVIILTQQSNPAISPVTPLLLLGLPLLDTFLVIGQRLYEGRSPFKPDKNHLHHRLLSLGFDHYEAVVIVYTIQAAMVISAVWMRFQSDLLNAVLFVTLCGAVIALFKIAAVSGWRAGERQLPEHVSPLTKFIVRIKARGVLTRYPLWFIAIGVPSYLIYAIWKIEGVPVDTAVTIFVLLCVSVGVLVLNRREPGISLIERLVICTTITAGVYYALHSAPPTGSIFVPENLFFFAVVLAILLIFRFSTNHAFRVTPMDFLVIFAVIIVPNLMGEALVTGNLSEIAAKAVVLYYGTELVIAQSPSSALVIRGVITAVLGVFSLRVLLGQVPGF